MEQRPNQVELKVERFSSDDWVKIYQDVKPKWWQFWKKEERILVMESEPSKLPFSFAVRPQIEADIEHLERRADFYQFKEEVLDKGGSISDYHKWKDEPNAT